VFENTVSIIFGAKRDEVTGGVEKICVVRSSILCSCSSPNVTRMIKSRRMRWAEHVARMGAMINAYKISLGESEGKRPLGKLGRRLEDNIKMDLR
jgi:hypothetical protein